MRRLLGLVLCLAAAWLLYLAAVELFVMWYSGAEVEPDRMTMVAFGVQAAVNVAAIVLGWGLLANARLARRSAPDEAAAVG